MTSSLDSARIELPEVAPVLGGVAASQLVVRRDLEAAREHPDDALERIEERVLGVRERQVLDAAIDDVALLRALRRSVSLARRHMEERVPEGGCGVPDVGRCVDEMNARRPEPLERGVQLRASYDLVAREES